MIINTEEQYRKITSTNFDIQCLVGIKVKVDQIQIETSLTSSSENLKYNRNQVMWVRIGTPTFSNCFIQTEKLNIDIVDVVLCISNMCLIYFSLKTRILLKIHIICTRQKIVNR